MNVFKKFKRLVSELQKQAVRYALIGGVAMAFMLSRGLQGILTSSLIPRVL